MSLSSPWRRSADLLAQHQQDAVGRHRAGDHFRQLFAGEAVVQIGGRIGGAQLMLQAPAEGDQQLGDLLMHRRFVRQQALIWRSRDRSVISSEPHRLRASTKRL